MQRFPGRRVLLTGEVKSFSDGKVVMRTSDDAEVTVICNPNFSGSFDTAFVEVGEGSPWVMEVKICCFPGGPLSCPWLFKLILYLSAALNLNFFVQHSSCPISKGSRQIKFLEVYTCMDTCPMRSSTARTAPMPCALQAALALKGNSLAAFKPYHSSFEKFSPTLKIRQRPSPWRPTTERIARVTRCITFLHTNPSTELTCNLSGTQEHSNITPGSLRGC